MGNDAVFALTVGQVVWRGHTAPGSKHGIPPLLLSCLLGHAASHRCGIAINGLGVRNAPGTMVFLRVTPGKAVPETGENARVAFVLPVFCPGPNNGMRKTTLVGLDSCKIVSVDLLTRSGLGICRHRLIQRGCCWMGPLVRKPGGSLSTNLLALWVLLSLLRLLGRRWLLSLHRRRRGGDSSLLVETVGRLLLL